MVEEILGLFSKTDAKKTLEMYAMRYKEKAILALSRTELTTQTKVLLEQIAHSFVPSVITESR